MKNKETNKKLVNIENAREGEQMKVMEQILSANHCPFCPDNLKKYHKQPIIKEGKYWLLTKNQWPYKNTKVHLMAIYTKHAQKLSEIDEEAGKELLEFFKWAEKEFEIAGGGFSMRFGDTDYSGGTVSHIHAQFIMPDFESKDYEPVRIKIGNSKNTTSQDQQK